MQALVTCCSLCAPQLLATCQSACMLHLHAQGCSLLQVCTEGSVDRLGTLHAQQPEIQLQGAACLAAKRAV